MTRCTVRLRMCGEALRVWQRNISKKKKLCNLASSRFDSPQMQHCTARSWQSSIPFKERFAADINSGAFPALILSEIATAATQLHKVLAWLAWSKRRQPLFFKRTCCLYKVVRPVDLIWLRLFPSEQVDVGHQVWLELQRSASGTSPSCCERGGCH